MAAQQWGLLEQRQEVRVEVCGGGACSWWTRAWPRSCAVAAGDCSWPRKKAPSQWLDGEDSGGAVAVQDGGCDDRKRAGHTVVVLG
ncbi:DUF523 domain-containing protein [Sesbania bispinosa]|nr:DUF523 domain-containing protein [Sesbania bispinosa]